MHIQYSAENVKTIFEALLQRLQQTERLTNPFEFQSNLAGHTLDYRTWQYYLTPAQEDSNFFTHVHAKCVRPTDGWLPPIEFPYRYEFDIKQRPSNTHGVKRQYQLMPALPIRPSPYAITRKVTTRKWTANADVVQDDAESDKEPPHYATTEEF